MAYRNLDEFIARLEQEGEVAASVSGVDLDVTQNSVQICTDSETGTRIVRNLFGTRKRIEMALRVESLDEIAAKLDALLNLGKPGAFGAMMTQAMGLFSALRTNTNRRALQQYTQQTFDDWRRKTGALSAQTPAMHATMVTGEPDARLRPVLITADRQAITVYGAPRVESGETVALVFGGDPAFMLAAMTPLPDLIHRAYFASWLRGRPLEMMHLPPLEFEVPSNAETVVVGTCDASVSANDGHFYEAETYRVTLSADAVWSRPDATYYAWSRGDYAAVRDAIKTIFQPLMYKLLPPDQSIETYLAHLKHVWLSDSTA